MCQLVSRQSEQKNTIHETRQLFFPRTCTTNNTLRPVSGGVGGLGEGGRPLSPGVVRGGARPHRQPGGGPVGGGRGVVAVVVHQVVRGEPGVGADAAGLRRRVLGVLYFPNYIPSALN